MGTEDCGERNQEIIGGMLMFDVVKARRGSYSYAKRIMRQMNGQSKGIIVAHHLWYKEGVYE